MSANACASTDFAVHNATETLEWESSCPQAMDSRKRGWNADEFAREQIRGLVRQVFFSSADRKIRQVVLSAVDPGTEVLSICRQVGEALASETTGAISVVGGFPQIPDVLEIQSGDLAKETKHGSERLRQTGTKVRRICGGLRPKPRRERH